MVRATSEKVGRGACPSCGEPVTYRKSAGGMLTHKCDACDSSGYAEQGGTAYAARMKTIHQPTKAPDPETKPEPPPPAAKKPAFSLSDL